MSNEYNAEEVEKAKEVKWVKQNIKSLLKKKNPKKNPNVIFAVII